MNKSFLFIQNPQAGESSGSEFREAFAQWQKRSAHRAELIQTSGENDAQMIREKVKRDRYHSVVAVGGDGTLNLVANACYQRIEKIAFFPEGSANGMARELALPEEREALFAILEHARTQKCDLLSFDQGPKGIHISDLGLNAELVRDFEESEERGMMAYTKNLSRRLAKAQKFKLSLETERGEEQHEALMVALANARFYGTGAALNQKGSISDGLMEVCLLHHIAPFKLAGHFVDMIPDQSEHMTVHQARCVRIEADRAVPFQIDGELMGDVKRLEAKVIPEAFEIYIP